MMRASSLGTHSQPYASVGSSRAPQPALCRGEPPSCMRASLTAATCPALRMPAHSLTVPLRPPTQSGHGLLGGATAMREAQGTHAVWTRPSPNKDEEFIRPSYVPSPSQQPWVTPRREESGPLYTPPPEFKPAELPDQYKEMPSGPKMPERRPDPIPASKPKEKPPAETEKEAPPPKEKEAPKK